MSPLLPLFRLHGCQRCAISSTRANSDIFICIAAIALHRSLLRTVARSQSLNKHSPSLSNRTAKILTLSLTIQSTNPVAAYKRLNIRFYSASSRLPDSEAVLDCIHPQRTAIPMYLYSIIPLSIQHQHRICQGNCSRRPQMYKENDKDGLLDAMEQTRIRQLAMSMSEYILHKSNHSAG